MKNTPYFNWDEATGLATCIITDGSNIFYGSACCHPEDLDMISEKTGLEIAHRRALIEALKHKRNNELKPQLAILKQVYYTMKHSKKFNEKSYENKMLQRKLKEIQTDLETITEVIKYEKDNLKQFIKMKDEFYQKLRARRNRPVEQMTVFAPGQN